MIHLNQNKYCLVIIIHYSPAIIFNDLTISGQPDYSNRLFVVECQTTEESRCRLRMSSRRNNISRWKVGHAGQLVFVIEFLVS